MSSDTIVDFVTTTTRVARKTHRCDMCSWNITPGTKYYHTVAKIDGGMVVYKSHIPYDELYLTCADVIFANLNN